jgi:hypothetical protein
MHYGAIQHVFLKWPTLLGNYEKYMHVHILI